MMGGGYFVRGVTDANFVTQKHFVGVGPRSSVGHQSFKETKSKTLKSHGQYFCVENKICRGPQVVLPPKMSLCLFFLFPFRSFSLRNFR